MKRFHCKWNKRNVVENVSANVKRKTLYHPLLITLSETFIRSDDILQESDCGALIHVCIGIFGEFEFEESMIIFTL